MRKVDPAFVRKGFTSEVDELIGHFDRVCSALRATPTEKQDVSRLASTSFMAVFVSFERFQSDLVLAYLNRDFSTYEQRLIGRVTDSVRDKFGAGVVALVTIRPKGHVRMDELQGIVDPNGFNLTFSSVDRLKDTASQWLTAAHVTRIKSITQHEGRLMDTARSIRDFIAHRSAAARATMNNALSTIQSGTHNRNLGRGPNEVHSVGSYLKAEFSGRRRLHLYADGLKNIATHI